jgi:hypothetical protein
MKFSSPLIAVAVALALAGCANKPKKEEIPDCVFPQTKERAPQWVCQQGPVVEGAAISAVGSWQKTGAGVAFQQDQATLVGRTRLAQQMRVLVTSGLKQAIQTTGAGSAETVDQVASSASKSISNETLVGSKVIRTAYAADGMLYVLVAVDEAGAKRVVDQALKTSMNNDRAQWQQFQGAKLQADLAAEVYKLGSQGMR